MIRFLKKRGFSNRAVVTAAAFAVLWTGLFSAALLVPHDAHALRVTMKRIVFEGPVRAETLTVVNSKATEQTFRLGWKEMRMTEDQALTTVNEGDDMTGLRPASDMIRYAPRRITLPPGGSQQVRLMLRRPRDLAEGEYRSHFWITPEAGVEEFATEKNDGKSAVKLSILAGITLPVFVRAGKLEARGAIQGAAAVRSGDGIKVTMTVTREGDRSLYGDVEFVCASSGDSVLYTARGVAVYPEVDKRRMKFTVANKFHEDTAGCKSLRIRYMADKKDSFFKGALIAETTVPVN